MNNIKINGINYQLHIGLKFIRTLDKIYTHKFGDVDFGFGVGKMLLNLSQYNPTAVADYIMAATCTLPIAPTEEQIEAQLMAWPPEELMAICEAFLDALAMNPLTRPQIAQMGLVSMVLEAKAANEELEATPMPETPASGPENLPREPIES